MDLHRIITSFLIDIQRPGQNDEGMVAALGGALAERLVEVEQLAKGRPATDIHDALVILRAFRGESVGAIALQLVGEVAAGDKLLPNAPAPPSRVG